VAEGREQSDTPIIDLEEQIEHAVLLMRDLEGHRHRLDPESYRTQRANLEVEASDAMRLRDERLRDLEKAAGGAGQKRGETRNESGDAVVGFFDKHPELKGFLWGAVVFSVAFGLYMSVVEQSKPRAQGQVMTGTAAQPAAEAPQENPELRELLAKLKENPEHVPSMVQLGKILLFQQMHKEAAMVTERALQVAPQDSGVLVNHAMVMAAKGDKPGAISTLDGVLSRDETFYDAWFFKGMLSMQTGDTEGMRVSFEKYVAHAPESPRRARIKKMLEGGGMQMPGAMSPARSNQ
jgi:cytochrome c-type biogenesis protein CcmH/NrfG